MEAPEEDKLPDSGTGFSAPLPRDVTPVRSLTMLGILFSSADLYCPNLTVTYLLRTCSFYSTHSTKTDKGSWSQWPKDTVVPLYTPITGVDEREMHEIVISKGTTVIVSIINYNQDPTLWGPDSYEWKPERWLSPLLDTIKESPAAGVYSHLYTINCTADHRALNDDVHRRRTGMHVSVFQKPIRYRVYSGFEFSELEMSAWFYWIDWYDW